MYIRTTLHRAWATFFCLRNVITYILLLKNVCMLYHYPPCIAVYEVYTLLFFVMPVCYYSYPVRAYIYYNTLSWPGNVQ